jgi:hypothetical protein
MEQEQHQRIATLVQQLEVCILTRVPLRHGTYPKAHNRIKNRCLRKVSMLQRLSCLPVKRSFRS